MLLLSWFCAYSKSKYHQYCTSWMFLENIEGINLQQKKDAATEVYHNQQLWQLWFFSILRKLLICCATVVKSLNQSLHWRQIRNFLKAILDPKKLSNFFLSPILPKQNETKQKIIQILALFCQVSSGQCFISIPPETIKKPGVFQRSWRVQRWNNSLKRFVCFDNRKFQRESEIELGTSSFPLCWKTL